MLPLPSTPPAQPNPRVIQRVLAHKSTTTFRHRHHYHRRQQRPCLPPAPIYTQPMSQERKRSTSRTRVSRPTTPLRPSSRSSFRDSARASGDAPFPLNAFEPQFGELSDAMADLEANLMHFQLMHESLARFSESFASFLYGLNMNAFCVDFPEASSRPPTSSRWGCGVSSFLGPNFFTNN